MKIYEISDVKINQIKMMISRNYSIDEEEDYINNEHLIKEFVATHIKEETNVVKFDFSEFDKLYWKAGNPAYVKYISDGRNQREFFISVENEVSNLVKEKYRELFSNIENFIYSEEEGDVVDIGIDDYDEYKRIILSTMEGELSYDEFIDRLKELSTITLIFIFSSKIGEASIKSMKLGLNKRGVEYQYFRRDEFLSNITERSSYIEKVSEEELDYHLSNVNYTVEQFPLILETDPLIKFYGYKHGDVIKVYRVDGGRTRNPNLYFRKVSKILFKSDTAAAGKEKVRKPNKIRL